MQGDLREVQGDEDWSEEGDKKGEERGWLEVGREAGRGLHDKQANVLEGGKESNEGSRSEGGVREIWEWTPKMQQDNTHCCQ